ncbi:MAG: hypothetical protein JNM76_08340 [Betaproteobacteria bacterium]|nr:hypothetical protein [Betaproteobacteria bacterium]
MTDAFESFLANIREQLRINSETEKPWHSFWYHRPTRDFPPRAIQQPDEWPGGERLSLACTQTALKPAEQKKLLARWCELLPTLKGIRFLWLQSRCPQELFEAACSVEGLEGLYVKWGPMTDLRPIAAAPRLKYLHIGSAPSLAPMEALADLKQLEWLELANIRALEDLAFLRSLTTLRGLGLAGDGNSIKYIYPASLEPLAALQALEWLSLTTLGVRDESLRPLARLPRLKHLMVANSFKFEEFAWLAGSRPDIECDGFTPVGEPVNWTLCKTCKGKTMVLLAGKGKPWSCQVCDAARIAKHEAAFRAVVHAARTESGKHQP